MARAVCDLVVDSESSQAQTDKLIDSTCASQSHAVENLANSRVRRSGDSWGPTPSPWCTLTPAARYTRASRSGSRPCSTSSGAWSTSSCYSSLRSSVRTLTKRKSDTRPTTDRLAAGDRDPPLPEEGSAASPAASRRRQRLLHSEGEEDEVRFGTSEKRRASSRVRPLLIDGVRQQQRNL